MFGLSEKLKTLRKQNNLTQEALAFELGVTKSVISAYERGTRMPSYDILVHLASMYDVSIDYLLGFENKNLLDLSGLTPDEIEAIKNLVNAIRAHQY